MQIKVISSETEIIFDLNESNAAKNLIEQLPLKVKVENYSNDEKIFYPKEKLNIRATPRSHGRKGELAYYAPWGDVVMFYRDFSMAPGLYNLGKCVSDKNQIERLTDEILIERI